MKIVINAASAKMGGAANYMRQILPRLPGRESGLEFIVFLPPVMAQSLPPLRENVRLVSIGPASPARQFWWNQIALRRLLRRFKADVLFSSANFAMLACPVRQILLVRISLYFSDYYLRECVPLMSWRGRIDFYFRRWLCKKSVGWADKTLTPSRAMRDELCAALGLSAEKFHVNPYGVASPWQSLSKCRRRQLAGSVHLLYVSHYAFHKNLHTLLHAMAYLRVLPALEYHLFLTMDMDSMRREVLGYRDIELLRNQDIANSIVLLGSVDVGQIEELYQQSDIFIFPSLTESFGQPMVEAMSRGLPILAADTAINREICGDAALYFAGKDARQLAAMIQDLAARPYLREQLGRAGMQRVRQRFGWEEHVRNLLSVCLADRQWNDRSVLTAGKWVTNEMDDQGVIR